MEGRWEEISKDDVEGKARPCNTNSLLKPQFYKSVKNSHTKQWYPERPVKRTPRKELVEWEALEEDAKVGWKTKGQG